MKKIITLLLPVFVFCGTLCGQDTEASRIYEAGYKAYQEQNYYQAANLFEESRILAKSPVIKANSLRAQIGAWRMCEMPYREFKAIEALLTGYPDYADFKTLISREYELGALYYKGLREPAYWHLRWIPWLTGENKCIEIYNAVLKRAPFSPQAPQARLGLAHLYDEAGKANASLEQYRIIVRDFPDSREYRYALLALANGLLIKAERGDGDGRYIKEAYDVLMTFRTKFPKASEMPWVDRHIAIYKDILGKRYYDMACYYNKNGKNEAAKRYLAIVLRDYPTSLSAPPAEKLLVQLDKTFTPGDFVSDKNSRLPQLRTYAIPSEASRVLLLPGKNNHYLVPVPDLSNKENPSKENK